MTEIREVQQKYLKPPTYEQIFGFIEELGVNMQHFENYYGIASGILRCVKKGYKPLPKKYWHIFFTRTVPTYGTFNNFQNPDLKLPSIPKIKSKRKKIKKTILHDRLSEIK